MKNDECNDNQNDKDKNKKNDLAPVCGCHVVINVNQHQTHLESIIRESLGIKALWAKRTGTTEQLNKT